MNDNPLFKPIPYPPRDDRNIVEAVVYMPKTRGISEKTRHLREAEVAARQAQMAQEHLNPPPPPEQPRHFDEVSRDLRAVKAELESLPPKSKQGLALLERKQALEREFEKVRPPTPPTPDTGFDAWADRLRKARASTKTWEEVTKAIKLRKQYLREKDISHYNDDEMQDLEMQLQVLIDRIPNAQRRERLTNATWKD